MSTFRLRKWSCALLVGAASLLAPSCIYAQVAPEFGTHTSFNGGDFNMGLQGGIDLVDLDLSIRGDFTGRIGSKRMFVDAPDNPNLTYQYRERRYYLGLEAEKRFTLFEIGEDGYFGVCGMLWGGYTFGDYRGTGVSPYKGFKYRPRVAPYVYFSETVLLRAGYEYLPLRVGNVSDHRCFLAITFIINDV